MVGYSRPDAGMGGIPGDVLRRGEDGKIKEPNNGCRYGPEEPESATAAIPTGAGGTSFCHLQRSDAEEHHGADLLHPAQVELI